MVTAVIVRQILEAVRYLHGEGIVHRDLKPENILMTSLSEGARIVVSDFGQSRKIPQEPNENRAITSYKRLSRMFTKVGTNEYAAP